VQTETSTSTLTKVLTVKASVVGDINAEIANSFDKKISNLLTKGNLAQAEILLRLVLEEKPNNAKAYNDLGLIASELNISDFSVRYFSEAVRLAPDWSEAKIHLEQVSIRHRGEADQSAKSNQGEEKFLLIRAWGFGFWSDVSHVLGQCLLAEMTDRKPIVYWGRNSLFGDGTSSNAFSNYFENVSEATVDGIINRGLEF